jgi:hypothetical protein
VEKTYEFPATITVPILDGQGIFSIDNGGWYSIFVETNELADADTLNVEPYVLITKTPLAYQNPSGKTSGIYIPLGEVCTLWLQSGLYYVYSNTTLIPQRLLIYQHNDNPFKITNNNTIKRELKSIYDKLMELKTSLDNFKVFGWFNWYYDFTITGSATTFTSISLNDILNGVIGNLTKSWNASLPNKYLIQIVNFKSRISGYGGTSNYILQDGIHFNNTETSTSLWMFLMGAYSGTSSIALANIGSDSVNNNKCFYDILIDNNTYILDYFINGNSSADLARRLILTGVIKYV